MKLDTLEGFSDGELQAVISRAQELLKQHDTERKEKALSEARALLAAAGLSLKDVARKAPVAKAKSAVYNSGRKYQHPADKTLVWPGKGKKPGWLTVLEKGGGKAIEMAQEPAGDDAPPLKKAG